MRQKVFTDAQVSGMFKEFGVDMMQRIGAARDIEGLRKVYADMLADAKREFKRMALRLHPDRNDGDDTEFKRINATLQLLEALVPNVQQARPVVQPVTIVVNMGGGYYSNSTTSSTTGSTFYDGGW